MGRRTPPVVATSALRKLGKRKLVVVLAIATCFLGALLLFAEIFVLLPISIVNGCHITAPDRCTDLVSPSGRRIAVITEGRGTYIVEGDRVYRVNGDSIVKCLFFWIDKHAGRVSLHRSNPKLNFDPMLQRGVHSLRFRAPPATSGGSSEEVEVSM